MILPSKGNGGTVKLRKKRLVILPERRVVKSCLKGGDVMVIKIDVNLKLHKISITIKRDRSAEPGTVNSAK